MIVGGLNKTVLSRLFDVELAMPIKVSYNQFYEMLQSGDPIRTWSKKVRNGGTMIRTLQWGPGPSGNASYDYEAYGHMPLISLNDGDEWRTIVLDSVWKFYYKNQLYVIN